MTLKVCGMTLDEIDGKFNEFEAERKKQIKLYKAGKLPEQPSMPNFITDDEFAFARKLFDPLTKAINEIYDRLEHAESKERETELQELFEKLANVDLKCSDIYMQHPSF